MSGLSRFDFYPRDWHIDTRDLSNAAKGVYIDLLASMYARGGPLPFDERELCQLCGCATVRSLRPLLGELIKKGKAKVRNGELVNDRAMEEIAKFDRQRELSAAGGRSSQRTRSSASELRSAGIRAEYELNTGGTQPETRPDIQQNQGDNLNLPSPSPSPKENPPTEGARPAPPDPKKPVYDLGKRLLGGRSGGQVTNLLRHHGGDLAATMCTLQRAAGTSDPREYVGAILRGDRMPETDWGALYRQLGVS
jgi:uncharacterized protein YdaU (DUF1376 family)